MKMDSVGFTDRVQQMMVVSGEWLGESTERFEVN